ncbi:TVP38/TMEM64 family inner membrane protein YdjZ [Acaryochloris thomasi RCC1774]|uniref:TVP38/TMEM64 family membrane protein n=1 Tax=Acaryochloris thomasi RCC1774 TaxID=1764569 RepID=A0A2W1JAI9_9CYAN|nr:TVP38/TMEM64 family protein [Acaryochloris thomasi]PZD71018.1 TVP38/TMEM64 family inner membrane protein YdjZ [Acaryochloris thomasi RCC1774]
MTKRRSHRQSRRWRVLFSRPNAISLLVLIGCLLVCWWIYSPPDLSSPETFKQTVINAGWLGPFVYIGIVALSVVISPIPGAPIAVAAGAIWGSLVAGIYSVIGGFIGSLAAYYIGLTLGRSAVYALTGKLIYFSKERGELYLGWLIFLTRLLPVLSFDLMSYGAGITGLSLPIYATATLLGMIPSTLLLTYMGSAFTIGLPESLALAAIFLVLLVGLPWGIRRYNWFGMKNIIRVE